MWLEGPLDSEGPKNSEEVNLFFLDHDPEGNLCCGPGFGGPLRVEHRPYSTGDGAGSVWSTPTPFLSSPRWLPVVSASRNAVAGPVLYEASDVPTVGARAAARVSGRK